MKTCGRVVAGVGPLEESKGQIKDLTGKQTIWDVKRCQGLGQWGRDGGGGGCGMAGIGKDSDFEGTEGVVR